LDDTPVIALSTKPEPATWTKTMQAQYKLYDQLCARICKGRTKARYINCYNSFLGRNARPNRQLFAEDGLHLSSMGYAIWAAVVHDVLREPE